MILMDHPHRADRKIRRFLSIDPTATYFASVPNFAQVALPEVTAEYIKHLGLTRKNPLIIIIKIATNVEEPVPDKSGKVLIQLHSDLTFATW